MPGMANPSFLQPLLNGGLVAAEPYRAFLFDGQQWKVYDSLRELVEGNYAWLKEHIDNTAGPYDYYGNLTILGRDATGRVWLAECQYDGNLDKSSGAYDGTSWSAIPKAGFRMNSAGDRVAAGGLLRDSSVWPPNALTALPGQRGWAWFDRQGGVWATGDNVYSTYRCNRDRFMKIALGEGLPLLEDSAGRFWLGGLNGWWLLLPNGQTSETLHYDFSMVAPVIEQGRGIFWAFAADGLLRLHVEEPKGGKAKIVIDKRFPRLVPQGEIQLLGLDKTGNLWLATRFGKSGLYRIELPPLKDAKP